MIINMCSIRMLDTNARYEYSLKTKRDLPSIVGTAVNYSPDDQWRSWRTFNSNTMNRQSANEQLNESYAIEVIHNDSQ